MSDTIRRAQRVEQWLADEDVAWALAELEKANYELFRTARDDEGRRTAQARAHVLESFHATLRAIVDAGEVEKAKREHEAQNAAER